MRSFNQYKNLINTTQTLSTYDIKCLFLFINKEHKQTAITKWMQTEFQECELLFKDFYTHMSTLRLSHEGKGGKLRTKSPLSPDNWYEIRHAVKILFIGMHQVTDQNEFNIFIPLYQIITKEGRGFKYVISGGKPVVINS